jgi:hypothetical protein
VSYPSDRFPGLRVLSYGGRRVAGFDGPVELGFRTVRGNLAFMVIRTLARYVRPVCLILLTLALAISPMRAATDLTINVTQGGVGVEGAFVALTGSGATKFAAITDATGKAVFSQVPDGSYVALASAPGTSAGSVAVVTPTDTTKTITVNGSGTVFSPLGAYGSQSGAIVADGLSGVFYLNTNVIPPLYRTVDFGRTWAPVTISSDDKTFGIPGSFTVTNVTTSGFPGEVAALQSDGSMYFSTDFGVTWTKIQLPLFSSFSKLLWSHPAAAGAQSMLFYLPGLDPTMYYALMPTATSPAVPTGFTRMAVPYRATVSDPISIANGSDAGIMVVGATTISSAPSRSAGDIKLYKISAAPNGNSDASLTINNSVVPGSVPTIATDGTSALFSGDLFTVRLGGRLLGPTIGSTTIPNTIFVYADRTTDAASNAALTVCAGLVCTANTSTTFRDLSGAATTSGSLSSSSSTLAVACGATRASGGNGFVSPRGDVATLGRCWLAKTGGSLDVGQVPNTSSTTSMAFDIGYNGENNIVVMSADGSHGPIKSARQGTTATEGPNRPYFPPYPAAASGGTAASSGGVAVNGLNSGYLRDITFNPSVAAQLTAVMSATGGGRVSASADSGRTWFDIYGQGGDSLAWWNGPGGTQWLLAGAGSGNLLAASPLSTTATIDSSTTLTAIPNSTATALSITGGTSNIIVPAIEGITGTNSAIVAAGRTNTAVLTSGFAEGSLSFVTLLPGPTATISAVTGGKFTNAAPVSLAYCDTSAPAAIADKMFIALASSASAGSSGSVKILANASQSSRAIQSLLGLTGDFQVVRADCATSTVWAGKNSPGSRGLLKSTDGGGTFSTISTIGRPNEILQKVQSLAIDPRAPSHVVVISIENDVVETKDGGFTWTVLNDSSSATCPNTFVNACGHTFGAPPSAIELPPKVAGSAMRATGPGDDGLRATSQVGNDQAVVGTAAGLYAATTRSVQRSGLTFGGVVRGSEVIITGGQTVNLSFASSGVNWTASSDQPFVVVSPASGTGNTSFTVSINNTSGAAVQPGTYNATITIQTTGALVSTQTITVAFVVVAASAQPIGIFDTPVDQSTGLQGSIAVSGWALDDIEIDKVQLWRDVAPGETTPPVTTQNPADPRNGKIFISDVTFVDGARPDVEAQFGTYPRSYRAGWGYLMLTWGLWNQGNGPFTLYAFALDKEGNIANIGTKSITVNNNAANKPFGSIDTPGIGATVSGTQYVNFGWGLTPKVNGAATCKILSNGVQVSIDSGPLQPVDYGDNRTDIAGAFAGFSNSNAAGGHYVFNTAQYANGPHTIGWLITDDCNRADGVGSRFFNIQNASQLAGSGSREALRPSVQVQAAENGVDSPDVVTVAHGYGNLPVTVGPDATGLRLVHVKQGDRIELRLPRGYDEAYQRVNGIQRALPAGATWDAASGIFYWQPAAAFFGSYELVFTRQGEQVRVRIVIDPSKH